MDTATDYSCRRCVTSANAERLHLLQPARDELSRYGAKEAGYRRYTDLYNGRFGSLRRRAGQIRVIDTWVRTVDTDLAPAAAAAAAAEAAAAAAALAVYQQQHHWRH